MSNDVRNYLNTVTEYYSKHRDRIIDFQGISVQIDRPTTEDNIDDFGDLIQGARNTSTITIIPRYDAYHMILNLFAGADIEQDLPLEVIAKVSDYVPNDSTLHLPINAPDNSGAPIEPWKVLSSEIKYLEKSHVRVLKCVPNRVKIS